MTRSHESPSRPVVAGSASGPATAVRVLHLQPRLTSDVRYHHDRAPGQKYLVLAASVVSDATMYVATRRVDGVPLDQPLWLDPHAHHCNSYYVFLGDGPRFQGLQGVVEIGERRLSVESPAVVFMPPFVIHRYRLTAGNGWYAQITLHPTYNGSLAPRRTWRSDVAPAVATQLHRRIVPSADVISLIDADFFPQPGVEVTLTDVRSKQTITTSGRAPVRRDVTRTLHVLLSRGTSAASLTLHQPIMQTLTAPVALLATTDAFVMRDVRGSPFCLTIRQTAESATCESGPQNGKPVA
jgi:2-isopropylmalate synthase